MATKKSVAQLDREIAEALANPSSKEAKSRAKRRKFGLFYLSDQQEGGKSAVHFERFDKLAPAIDALARLPQGSITYGNAEDGPQFMIVWATPQHTDLLYWTDTDLNVQPGTQVATKAIRDRQAPPGKRKGPHGSEQYFNNRFEQVRRKHWS